MGETVCAICSGTGKTVHMRSWFTTDGFYRVRCGICAGTGKSSFRDAAYAKEQARLRALSRHGEGE